MAKTTPEQNKALVLEAFDTLFNKRDYAAAERRRRSSPPTGPNRLKRTLLLAEPVDQHVNVHAALNRRLAEPQ